MKKFIKLLYCLLIVLGFVSCEKDTITNSIMDNKERTIANTQALKKALHNAPNGWVMMVKSGITATTYTPVVMKFDTTSNIVDIKTVYGITDPNPSYFEISSGTGSLILTFSTSSIITSFFRIGLTASDVTDHIYKVLSVSNESIQIQGYRSGSVYKPEGGVIYTLFKRPADWQWADNTIVLDYTNPTWRIGTTNRDGTFDIKYTDGSPDLNLKVKFGAWTDAQIATLRGRDPFVGNISAKGFVPMYNMIFDQAPPASATYNTTTDRTAPIVGHNAIAFYPFTSTGTTSGATNANILAFTKAIKTHYLVLTSMTRSNATATALIVMNFAAYDKTGKVYLTAKYTIN